MATAEMTGRPRSGDVVSVPVTMIVAGVLNGSTGGLMYPRGVLQKVAAQWDGAPVTYHHPSANGAMVGVVNTPDIIVGRVRKPTFRGDRIRATAEINLTRLAALDPMLAGAVRRGERVEVSTGLFPKLDGRGGTWQGQDYHSTVTAMTPDHLAILPAGARGACSIQAGCGLSANNSCECSACVQARQQRGEVFMNGNDLGTPGVDMCPNCGQKGLPEGANYCPACGQYLRGYMGPQPGGGNPTGNAGPFTSMPILHRTGPGRAVISAPAEQLDEIETLLNAAGGAPPYAVQFQRQDATTGLLFADDTMLAEFEANLRALVQANTPAGVEVPMLANEASQPSYANRQGGGSNFGQQGPPLSCGGGDFGEVPVVGNYTPTANANVPETWQGEGMSAAQDPTHLDSLIRRDLEARRNQASRKEMDRPLDAGNDAATVTMTTMTINAADSRDVQKVYEADFLARQGVARQAEKGEVFMVTGEKVLQTPNDGDFYAAAFNRNR